MKKAIWILSSIFFLSLLGITYYSKHQSQQPSAISNPSEPSLKKDLLAYFF